MISLDQVILLEQKVESAVAKIQQLKEENAALRKQCSELTNALSSKSEQLSSFENDQNQIENGIKKALDRLNSIENSVIKTAAANMNQGVQNSSFKKNITTNQTFNDLQPVKNQEDNFSESPVTTEIENPEEAPYETENQLFNNKPLFDSKEEDLSDSQEISEEINDSEADNAFNNEMYQTEEPDYDETSGDISEGQTNLGFDIF